MDSLMVFIEEVISRDACDSRGVFPLVGEGKVVVWWENPSSSWKGWSTSRRVARSSGAEGKINNSMSVPDGYARSRCYGDFRDLGETSYGPRVSRGLKVRASTSRCRS